MAEQAADVRRPSQAWQGWRRLTMAIECDVLSCRRVMSVVVVISVTEHASDEFPIDHAKLAPGSKLECICGKTVRVAQSALGLLVDQCDGVGIEDLALAASLA